MGDTLFTYSAWVPRSSLAEVHREFVHHIVEEEADGQEEKEDDRGEDRQQEEESGGESNTQRELMKITHEMM